MKKIDLGQTLTILANIGVIAGIVFLAIEIRDSAIQASNSSLQGATSNFSDWHSDIARDPETARIYLEGRANYSGLSEIDQMRFDQLMRSRLIGITTFIDSRNEVITGDPPTLCLRAAEGYLFELLDQPGFRQWWSTADLRGLPLQILTLLEDLDGQCAGDISGN